MSQLIVISAIGTDRRGAVQDLSQAILDSGGNILESRMTRLGREFAMLVLVQGNWHAVGKLEQSLQRLEANAELTIAIKPTEQATPAAERLPYAIDVISLDQQGIVFELSRFLASRDVDIAEVSSRSYAAAHTGAPMFAVQMNVGVPASLSIAQLREDFLELSDSLNLDAIIEPIKP
ncbi:MAG: ACT domain-containing protein [Pseudomonadota bacterium]